MIVTTTHQPEPERYPGGAGFGQTIRMRRVGGGFSLRKCASALKMTMFDLSQVETGQRRMTAAEFEAFNRLLEWRRGDGR